MPNSDLSLMNIYNNFSPETNDFFITNKSLLMSADSATQVHGENNDRIENQLICI